VTSLPIYRVDRHRAQTVETLGSKPKFWFLEDDRRLLFKADDRGTGEDWAEVVACHLCELLGLPHVVYHLAAEYSGDDYVRPGVICENMAPSPLTLVLGNELLLAIDPQYPKEQRFKVRQHSIEAVCDIISRLAPPASAVANLPDGVETALDVFAGYVMLDAWIANQDRHHENWGALWLHHTLRLAPTFDHGAALARNLGDDEREERLMTKDRNRTVAAFARRGRSAFYRTSTESRPLELRQAFQAFAEPVPVAAKSWLRRLAEVNRDDIWKVIASIPAERMSDVTRKFTLELLSHNQREIIDVG
jgi:hypothetical protein